MEINAKSSTNVKLPYELFRFAADVGNDTYNIGDLFVNSQNYVEIALGHSRDINSKWRVGAKLKVLLGVADADVKMQNVTAQLTGDSWTPHGDAQAHMSMKGWKYKTATKEYKSQEGSYSYINDVDVDGAGIGGVGLAADLGTVFRPDKYWEVSGRPARRGLHPLEQRLLCHQYRQGLYFQWLSRYRRDQLGGQHHR